MLNVAPVNTAKGLWQPIVYVMIVIISVSFFALTQSLHLEKISLQHSAVTDILKREREKIITHLEILDSDFNSLGVGDAMNSSRGVIVNNSGNRNAHYVSVYWVDWNSAVGATRFCKLRTASTSSTTALEIKGAQSARFVPSSADCVGGAPDSNLDMNDSIVVHSWERAFVVTWR